MKRKEHIKSNKLKEKIIIFMKNNRKNSTSTLLVLVVLLFAAFMLMGSDFAFTELGNKKYESLKADNTKITFTGDVSPSRYLKEKSKKYGPGIFYKDIESIWKDSDISLINLEAAPILGDPEDEKYTKPSKASNIYLDLNRDDIKAVKESGINLIGFGNNHSIDYGVVGLEESIEIFNDEEIDYIGAGVNIREAVKPYSEEINGEKIGIMAVTDIPVRGGLARNNRAGIYTTQYQYLDFEIEKMVNKNDFNVVYIHWGVEYGLNPDKEIRELGRELIDMGVDLVVGSHPHVLLPVEKYNDGAIVYSLGNLVFDQNMGRTSDSAIASLYLGEDGNYLEFVPIDIINGIPNITDKKRNKKRIFNNLTKELDETDFEIKDNKLIVKIK